MHSENIPSNHWLNLDFISFFQPIKHLITSQKVHFQTNQSPSNIWRISSESVLESVAKLKLEKIEQFCTTFDSF